MSAGPEMVLLRVSPQHSDHVEESVTVLTLNKFIGSNSHRHVLAFREQKTQADTNVGLYLLAVYRTKESREILFS